METEYKNAVGKSAGEVLRDVGELLATPFVIHPEKQIDLRWLLPDLNMPGQVAFALMAEALTQGWEHERAEGFVRRALATFSTPAETEAVLAAFRDREGQAYAELEYKYGNRFDVPGGAYWATVLALGIDADEIPRVMQYLRAFSVTMTEFAYMGDANPKETYTWGYSESFGRILDDLLREPDPAPKPLKVRAVGGTAGKRDGDSYPLSLGVDIENPNPDRMARDVAIDVTLKDRSGNVIAVLRDRISSIDPASVFHFGITKRIRGGAVASISATAKAASHLKLTTPIMKHIRLESCRVRRGDGKMVLDGRLTGTYDRPLSALCLHYQFLSAENKILGGGSEWFFDGMQPDMPINAVLTVPVEIKGASKVVYSVDFDALELI